MVPALEGDELAADRAVDFDGELALRRMDANDSGNTEVAHVVPLRSSCHASTLRSGTKFTRTPSLEMYCDNPRTEYRQSMVEHELTCDACGTAVRLDAGNGDVTMTREPASTPAPGRGTIRVGDDIVHQCADDAFLPPGDIATPA